MMRIVCLCLALAACAPTLAAEPQVLVGWEFNTDGQMDGWVANSHMADVAVAKGALSAKVVDWDPFVTSPVFDIPARQSQWIEARIRANHSGAAEFFWTNTLKTKFQGFSPGKETHFRINGDRRWHVYRIRPCWEPEKKIIRLRLDLPRDEGHYEVDYIRIVDSPAAAAATVSVPVWDFERDAQAWAFEDDGEAPKVKHGALTYRSGKTPRRLLSPPLDFEAEANFFFTVQMTVNRGETATLTFANNTESGIHTHGFRIIADGKPHSYIINMANSRHWRHRIRFVAFEPSNAAKAHVAIHAIHIARTPTGPPELVIKQFDLADGLARAGQRLSVAATFTNRGGSAAKGVRVTLDPPKRLKVLGPLTLELGDVWYGETRVAEWPVEATGRMDSTARLTVAADGLPTLKAKATFRVGRSLGLPKANYVPEPRPAHSDYQVGVYYFPGWITRARWKPIADFPERKPLLGWYDESLPEIADWQIKWAVEHGITFFAVDWYWCQGARHLEHWLHDAYFKARYRKHLKFCLLWANHNPPKTSSEADLLAVTDYWIEHYFKLPEHLTIDGKPVMIIFSPHRFTADLGTEGVAAAFEKMRERCRKAGLPGLYLVACTTCTKSVLERLKKQGYDATSGYNYPSLGSKGRRWHPYAENIEGYKGLWNTAADHKVLKQIPALSGGWDSRPWHGPKARVVFDRTPKLFERHCRDAKKFLDARDAEMPPSPKMCIVEAWNEWGEGSYIGPHREFGFDYLEAIRRVFAPHSPKPQAITPRDIGLGPYDLSAPTASTPRRTSWNFATPADRGEWRMGTQTRIEPSTTSLKGTSTGRDPIISGPIVRIPADAHPWLVVEMRTSKPERPQLFWSTTTAKTSENNSVRFDTPGDNAFHTHWVRLADTPYWQGLITSLRFDPVNAPGVSFEIRSIRFSREGPKE